MKSLAVTFFLLTFLLTVTFGSGCVSTGVKPQTVDAIAAVVQPLAKNVVNAVLAKNPKYDEALLALATGAEAALNGGDLSIQTIRSFVDSLGARYNLDRESKLFIASGIDDVLQFYRRTYAKNVVEATDPNVARVLNAFAAGIRDGVSFFRALNTAPAAALPEPQRDIRTLFVGAVGVPAIGRF